METKIYSGDQVGTFPHSDEDLEMHLKACNWTLSYFQDQELIVLVFVPINNICSTLQIIISSFHFWPLISSFFLNSTNHEIFTFALLAVASLQ